jgi:hypothetical protein
VGSNVPEYGCFGTSQAHQLAACIVGTAGVGRGGVPTLVTLVFPALAEGIEAPDSISIVEDERGNDGRPHDRPLGHDMRAKLETALAGFVSWDPVAEMRANGGTQRFAGKGVVFVLQEKMTARGGNNEPPRYDMKLEVQRGSRAQIVDDQKDRPLSEYVVRIFRAGEGFVLERSLHTADEGAYETQVDVWKCGASKCEAEY